MVQHFCHQQYIAFNLWECCTCVSSYTHDLSDWVKYIQKTNHLDEFPRALGTQKKRKKYGSSGVIKLSILAGSNNANLCTCLGWRAKMTKSLKNNTAWNDLEVRDDRIQLTWSLAWFLGLDFSFYTLYHYCHGNPKCNLNSYHDLVRLEVPSDHLVVASPQNVSLVMFHGNCHHSTPGLRFPDVTWSSATEKRIDRKGQEKTLKRFENRKVYSWHDFCSGFFLQFSIVL